MKKILGLLFFLIAVCVGAIGLVGCGEPETPPHVHSYTQQIVSADYKKQSATCETKAIYYYSCTCGEKGTEIFESGMELGHSFSNYAFNNDATCEENGTETGTCSREGCGEINTREKANTALGHNFKNYVYNNDATCEENGTETG